MYWIVHSIGSPKGQIKRHQFHPLSQHSASTIQKLLETGTIREIVSPPFEVLAALKNYGTLLHDSGCTTLMDVYKLGVDGLQDLIPALDAQATIQIIEQMLRPDKPLPDGACDCE